MTPEQFRDELRARLRDNPAKVLLRIVVDAEDTVELTGTEILDQAMCLASEYSSAPPGAVVLLLLPHSVELFLLHLGLLLTGRIPAILAWPTTRIDGEKYQRNLLHQLRNLPAQQVITLPRLAANLTEGLPYTVRACRIESATRWEAAFSTPLSPEQIATRQHGRPDTELSQALFLQFSGGTTGAQKAVVITSEILSAQLVRLREVLAFGPQDAVVSWLPMYHDMGLIACLWLPLWFGATSTQFAASDWLLNPGLLFEYIERHNGTFCWLPNFAFSYLAMQRKRMKADHSIRGMRAFINCSEPVRLRSFQEFAEQFAEFGARVDMLQASYAMAENVFAVTQTRLGERCATFARRDVRSSAARAPLAFDIVDEVYVSSGRALGDVGLRIVNDGQVCGETEPGEIQISTTSLFNGYWGSEGYVTSSFTDDHWYATGDYGFVSGGELYVIGRRKDIIIIAGQNVFPEDVEVVVNTLPAIYPGRVVAFGLMDDETNTEAMIVVAEMRGEYDQARAGELQRQIAKLVLSTIAIAPRRVMVVPERWIVKSTAGKISRRETRERYVRECVKRSTGVGAENGGH